MKKKNLYIESLLSKRVAPYQKFHNLTKIFKMGKIKESVQDWPEAWIKMFYKSYSRFEEIKLPKPHISKTKSFVSVLSERSSKREFAKKKLSKKELSTLFHFACGLSANQPFTGRRYYPSAGGRFPIEVYMLSLNSEIPQGYYHYYTRNNSLERLFEYKRGDLQKITTLDWVKKAGAIIFLSAVFERNINKYGQRGYRHVLAESGIVTQNIYLLTSALNLSCCAIGAYVDDNINSLLDLDGLQETVVGVIILGKKPELDDKQK